MLTIEKQFIPYEQALKLKELGFDELCLAYFKDDEFRIPNPHEPYINSELKSWLCTAPLYQQAFDWFKEEYNLYTEITLWGDGIGFMGMIKEIKQEEFIEVYSKANVLNSWNYQEVRQACLEKLIEIARKY